MTMQNNRFTNLSAILCQISDEIHPSELERMKRVCFDLQGGTNPVGIDRRLLSDVHEAFQLFVLQHDCHRDFFRRNVVDLLQKLPDQAKADTLIGLLMSCFRDIYSASKLIILLNVYL